MSQESLISEEGFTLDATLEKDSVFLMDLPLCRLLMANDSQFPWCILVPRRAGVSEIYQLDWQDQQQFLNESAVLSELLMEHFNGDKLNVAALGNVVNQLHIHHVVRYKNDPCFPAPIWGKLAAKPYAKEALEQTLRPLLEKLTAVFRK